MVQHGLHGRLLFCLSCQEVHPFKRTLPRQQNMNVRWFNLPQNGMMSHESKEGSSLCFQHPDAKGLPSVKVLPFFLPVERAGGKKGKVRTGKT